jgi:hypothetical protein
METGLAALHLVLALLGLPASPVERALQPVAPADSLHACDLVSNAEVQKVTGRPIKRPPDRSGNVQMTHSACSFREARVWIALSSTARGAAKHVEQELVVGGFDMTKQPVAGVGDSAVIHFKPKGRDPAGLLVAYAGTRTLTVAVKMEAGQPSDSARPLAADLAKVALARLR